MHYLTSFAVGQSVLEVEGARSEDASAVGAAEAFGMELLTHGVQTILGGKGRGRVIRYDLQMHSNQMTFKSISATKYILECYLLP